MPPKNKKPLPGRAASKFEHLAAGDEKNSSRVKKGMKAKARAAGGKFSTSDLVAKAEHFMDRMEPELALKFYERYVTSSSASLGSCQLLRVAECGGTVFYAVPCRKTLAMRRSWMRWALFVLSILEMLRKVVR
jgi:hypothetical protein